MARLVEKAGRPARLRNAVAAALVAIPLAIPLAATAAHAASLAVTVTGVRNDQGAIELCLVDKPADFPDCTGKPVPRRLRQPAHAGSVTFDLGDVPPGVYAVTVFHDEHGTHRVETNFLGIPRVGVGASRDARGRFGPPAFRDAAFSLGATPGRISLTLVYP